MSRDHSGSMRSIAQAACRDYNDSIATIKEAAVANNQDTIVSVVKCGYDRLAGVLREIVNSNVTTLQPLSHYEATAPGTPLFDSVNELIEMFKAVPDVHNPNVSFLVMATTDGHDNVSRVSGSALAAKMMELQQTDRWTFVFRVPRGNAKVLIKLGIPEGNILEWDQSERGMHTAQVANREAFTSYFKGRSSGMRSTTRFYANLSDVSLADVKQELTDISSQVKFFPVSSAENEMQIRDFVESKLKGEAMVKGGAFYKLVKTEPKVQDYKRIAIRSKSTGQVYAGDAARTMLALPLVGSVRLAPDNLGDFEVYIQSTSVNRKVVAGTDVMYWAQVGTAFKEGPSAR